MIFPKRDLAERVDRAKRKALVFKSKQRHPLRIRQAVQLITLAVIVVIGVQFADWVSRLERLEAGGGRPPGVEGFLPISAMIRLKHWLASGDFSLIHPAGLVLFGLICLSAVLLKKSFCSWLCPAGTISEYLARASYRIFRRRLKLPVWIDRPLMSLKYLLIGYLVYAVFIQMNPRDIALFLESPYNRIADIKMLYFFTRMSSLTAQVLAVLVGLSFVAPYFWCRYLCPYGALLGLLSALSPLKIVRRAPDCTDCGRCAAVCPAYLDVDRRTRVDDPECTGCLECVTQCPAPEALEVRSTLGWRGKVRPMVFAAGVVLVFFGGIGVAKLAGAWHTSISRDEFQWRVQELDDPKYHHARGQVPEYDSDD